MTENSRTPKKIRHHLKHFFIPHVHNDYRPHAFRETSIAIVLSTILFLFGLSIGSAYIIQGTEIGKNIVSKVLIDLTNKNRKENNLGILSDNPKLYNAALLKAKDMLSGQYFAHESPVGLTPWHFLEVANYDYTYAGENLAINHTDNNKTGEAWMNSPLHRKNILDDNFKEIGISAYSGEYEGRNTIFVVQMFGTPAGEYNNNTLYTGEVREEVGTTAKEPVVTSNKEEDKELEPKESETKEISEERPEPEIKTSNIKNVPAIQSVKISKNINEATNTEELIATNTVILKVEGAADKNYSKIYERLIYNGSNYVQNMLQILFIIIFIATLTDVLIEIKRQHMRHIAYAALLLIIILTLMYINKNYFEINFKTLF